MKRLFIFAILLGIPLIASAATADPTGASYDWIKVATTGLNAKLTTIGFKLFYLLTLLQLSITLIGTLGNGDIELALGKLAKGFLWMFFCLYLMTNNNAYNFIANTTQYFLNNAISWTTSTNAEFSSNGVIAAGLSGFSDTVKAINKAVMDDVPNSWTSILQGGVAVTLASAVMASITLGVIFLTILFCTAYIALKVFMIKVETALNLAILPFSLALLGLTGLREQGIAPFKTMLALIYRIIILGVVVGGMGQVGANLNAFANSEANPDIVQMALVGIFGYLLLAFIAFKADQIASSLASGSANLGSGDMVGSAIAGAAAGGAVVAALQGMLGAASGTGKTAQSMGDFMKKLGGEGSISNASQSGTGAIKEPSPAPTRSMASVTDTPGSSPQNASGPSGAPRRSQPEAESKNASSNQYSEVGGKPTSVPEPSSQATGATSTGTQQDTHATSVSQDAPQHGGGKPNEPIASIGNTAEPASIGGAPKREGGSGKPVDPKNGPKREKTSSELLKQNLGKLAEQTQQERQATHVSFNTHQHD